MSQDSNEQSKISNQLLFLRGAQATLLLFLFGKSLSYIISQDEKHRVFTWVESPTPAFWVMLIAVIISTTLWMFSSKLLLGPKPPPPALSSVQHWVHGISRFAWLGILLIWGQNTALAPPSSILAQHEVEVLKLYTPPQQSKPKKHYIRLSSWRGNSHETLYSVDWAKIPTFTPHKKATLKLGKNWWGQIQIMSLTPQK